MSFWSLVPIIYARWILVTAARTQVLPVSTARIVVGGDAPMSISSIKGGVQNKACVEFWDKYTDIIFLPGFPPRAGFDTVVKLFRETSSSL